MNRALPFALLLICFSCLTEDSADPGKASTFVRYYNGGFDDLAQAFEETPDQGFIILATTQITNSNVTVQRSKIKLIKTDRYGNTEQQTLYPAFGSVPFDPSYYKGRGILMEKDNSGGLTGYTIVGDSIDSNTGVPYLYIMQTDTQGNLTRKKSMGTLPDLQGQAIAKDGAGDYLILASKNNATDDMWLGKFSKVDLSLIWSREYGGGESTYLTGLITDANNNIYWGGTVNRGSDTDIRFISTTPDNGSALDPLTSPVFNEETGGMCYSAFGPHFLFVGTTDENGSKDILFKQVSLDGSPWQGTTRKIIGDSEIPEEGNAICTTNDGQIIIGTSGLEDARDYYLIKMNFLGDIMWSRIFGSNKADKGVSIRQASDGSYVILGATTLGGLGGIMLMKADSKGNIE